jgi:predicted Rossmann-fold nucleotide-binding protein
MIPEKIISGGQTGVDRAALDVAMALDIPCGGWCPRDRKSEDGVIPAKYPMQVSESASYRSRTRRNIEESDGTLILTLNEIMDRGTLLTRQICLTIGKPCLLIEMQNRTDSMKNDFIEWIRSHSIRVLNVAGCRESTCPGIAAAASVLLHDWLH